MKLTFIKSPAGGLTAVLSYIISAMLPWKELGGVFATLPAVFLVSLPIAGTQHRGVVAKHVSRGAALSMTDVLYSILATWAMPYSTHEWLPSILVGFVVWFISAVVIPEIVGSISRLRRRKDGRKTERSNNR